MKWQIGALNRLIIGLVVLGLVWFAGVPVSLVWFMLGWVCCELVRVLLTYLARSRG